jgi:hypothetical protein
VRSRRDRAALRSLPAENEVYPGKDELQITGREASDAFGQQRSIVTI